MVMDREFVLASYNMDVAERSLSHRATVVAVRHLLEALAAATTLEAGMGPPTFAGPNVAP